MSTREVRRLIPTVAAAAAVAVLSGVAVASASAQELKPDPRARGGDHHIAGLWDNRSGVLYSSQEPVLKGDYLKTYNDHVAAQKKSLTALDDRLAGCLPAGAPRMMFAPFPLEIIESAGQVTIIQESMSQTRRVFMDGRGHPKELEPSWNGHSIGRWDGDVLVIDTVGVRDDTVLDSRDVPHSDAMHLVERIWRSAPDTLQYEYTVDDAKAFAQPYSGKKTFRYRPEWDVEDWICENNREAVNAKGETVQQLKK